MVRQGVVLFASVVFLVGCGSTIERQIGFIDRFLRWNQIGQGADYWIVKYGAAGRAQVGVIFGFVDDGKFCREVADMYRAKYPASELYCEPVK